MDPASEHIQHAKKLRERIYDDDVYFISGVPPDNAPEWAYEARFIYETDETEYEEYKEDDKSDGYGIDDYVSIIWINWFEERVLITIFSSYRMMYKPRT